MTWCSDLRLLPAVLALLALTPGAWAADLVVVVNPKSGVERLDRDDVINIFLGRYRQLPSGTTAEPLDLPAAAPEKAAFYERLVGKNLAEINAYWARLVFSGRTAPPQQVHSVEQLLDAVASRPGAIGYVERARTDARVRIVFELKP